MPAKVNGKAPRLRSVADPLVSDVVWCATRTVALGVILAMSAPGVRGADEEAVDTAPVVTVVDERVSISATATPVTDLLALIGTEAGIDVRGHVADPRSVTVEFRDVPIRRAVQRLIGEQSFTMRYGTAGELRRITLGWTIEESSQPETRQAARQNFETALREHPHIRVDGLLARQFGKNEVPITRLLSVVRIQPEGPLRTEAMARFLAEVESDRILRRGLRELTSAQLLQFLRRYGGRHAPELARFLAAKAKDASVRQQAVTALRTLPKSRG
jgi:hypothetical protein